jgi:hypothetical protein
LSAEEQKRLLKEAEGKVEDNKEKAARRAEWPAKKQRREKRHAEKIAKAYEIEEREREGSGGTLDNWLVDPTLVSHHQETQNRADGLTSD